MARGRLQLKGLTGTDSLRSLVADRISLTQHPDMNHRYNERRAQERENKMRGNDQEGLDPRQETTVTLSFFHRRWTAKGRAQSVRPATLRTGL